MPEKNVIIEKLRSKVEVLGNTEDKHTGQAWANSYPGGKEIPRHFQGKQLP